MMSASPASPAPRQHVIASAFAALRAHDTRATRDACASLPTDDPDAMLLTGLASALDGEFADAAARLCALAASRPAHAHPATDLASLVGADDPRPLGLLRACLAVTPDDTRLTRALAAQLTEAGAFDEATRVLDAALAGAPGDAFLLNLRGIALGEAGRHGEAEAAFRASLAGDPGRAAAWSNLGATLKTLGRHDEAIAAHERAVAISPRDAQMQVNRAIALLRAGQMEAGFAAYEWRLAMPGHTTLPPARLMPRLAALDRLDGKTILVTHEEGYGDTLMCARYLPMLAGLGAQVIASVPDALTRLVAGIKGVSLVVPEAATPPDYDWHCPFLSLPRVFSTGLHSIPWHGPYLTADAALVARFAPLLPAGGTRIGVVWSGQARPWQAGFANVDRRRSTTADIFAPLARLDGVSLVSLQFGVPAPWPLQGAAIAEARDFADTAAIVAQLHAVVSVDTAIAHLAGALGIPVLLLDRFDGCWRWLHERETTLWYPSMSILRQPSPGDWTHVIDRAAGMLAARSNGG